MKFIRRIGRKALEFKKLHIDVSAYKARWALGPSFRNGNEILGTGFMNIEELIQVSINMYYLLYQ